MGKDYKTAPNSMIDYAHENTATVGNTGLNNADGLILSELSYLKIDTKRLKDEYHIDLGIGKDSISIQQLYKIYDSDKSIIQTRNISHQKDMDLLKNMAENPRFQNMEISNYCIDPVANGDTRFSSIGSGDSVEQFGAMTIKYNGSDGNPHNFVSFRGTNGTHEGWAEDFEMIYTGTTQAQLDSATYLNIVAGQMSPNEKIELGGHSKGGNDAEYAFLYCDSNAADKVCAVYGFDSPGISAATMNGTDRYEEYLRLSRGKHICPKDSIVGQLLRENGDSIFVESCESPVGFGEHDPFSWYMNPKSGSFDECDQSVLSRVLDDVLDTTIPTLSPAERRTVFEFADAATRAIFPPESGEKKSAAQTILDVALLVGSFEGNKTLLTGIAAKMLAATGYVGALNVGAALINGILGGHITAENISDFIDCTAETIEDFINGARETVQNWWESGMDTLREGWETVKETAADVRDKVHNTWEDLKEGASDFINSGKEFLNNLNPFSRSADIGISGGGSHGGGGGHRFGGSGGSGILSGVMDKLREDFNVVRHAAGDMLDYDIILDEEAFAKAAGDFEDLAEQIRQLRKDIEEQLEMLQHGFDTPAGHKFINSCRDNLLRPLEEQQTVVEHISETLQKCISEYQSVFDEYSDITALLASN